MEEVVKFLKECGAYFLATVEGDQPRVRPFQTSKTKDCSKQIQQNGKVEICAMNAEGNKWLRVAGTLVRDDRREPKADMLEHYPELRSMYSVEDPNTEVLYFKDATATFYAFGAAPRTVKF